MQAGEASISPENEKDNVKDVSEEEDHPKTFYGVGKHGISAPNRLQSRGTSYKKNVT